MSRLADATSEARQIYLRNTPRLVELARRQGWKEIPSDTDVFHWLMSVQVVENPRMGAGTNGIAYYYRNLITINPRNAARMSDPRLLDLVLHEFGHLFTHRFNKTTGHDGYWRMVGFVVGYVPIGCTSASRKEALTVSMVSYKMAAALGEPHPELGL